MMRLFILLTCVFYCPFLRSQTWKNEAYKEIVHLLELHKFDKANKKMDAIYPQIVNGPTMELIEYFSLYGYGYIQKKDYLSAISKIEEAMKLVYNMQVYDSKIHLKVAYLMAKAYFMQGKDQEAEQFIYTALLMSAKSWKDCGYTKKMYSLLLDIYKKRKISSFVINQIQKEMQFISDDDDVSLTSGELNQIDSDKYVSLSKMQEDSVSNIVYRAAIKSIGYANDNNNDFAIKILDDAETELQNLGQPNHPLVRILYTNKGKMYLRIGDCSRAKKLLLSAKKLFEKYDEPSEEYADCINSLAIIFQREGFYFYSLALLHCASKIIENTMKNSQSLDSYPAYCSVYDNLARNYYEMGDIENAVEAWKRIINSTIETDNRSFAFSSVNNLAYAKLKLGQYKESEEYLLGLLKHDLHTDIKEAVYQNLLLSSYLSNREDIIETLNEYIFFAKSNLIKILLSFSEEERDPYWAEHSLVLEMITNAICWKKSLPDIRVTAYDMALYTKCLSMKLPKLLKEYVQNDSSSQMLSYYKDLTDIREKLQKNSLSDDSIGIYKEQINLTERKILSCINNPTVLFNDSIINFRSVKNQLSLNDVAIEFVIIPKFVSTDSIAEYYGALIVKPKNPYPELIRLCERETLDLYVDNKNVNDIYSIDNNDLYNLILKPIEEYINIGDNIYFSPIGIIHKINLGALSHNGKRIMDCYNLYQVSSTAKLIDKDKTDGIPIKDDAYVFGGIDYNMNSDRAKLETIRKNMKKDSQKDEKSRSLWEEIPGSLYEAACIDSLLAAKGVSTTLLTKNFATEESLKQLSGRSPSILHIATHGFYYSNPQKLTSMFYHDQRDGNIGRSQSMSYSGLLFAGANKTWIGELNNNSIEDGIITAEEISLFDFSHTRLAVLSACDTALGEIDDIDGVYGLQRAFKIAGVETIIMSLWKISDEATRILMVEFYKNLMSGKTKHQSLKDAQKYLRNVDNGKYDDPKYWASFIMLDGLN